MLKNAATTLSRLGVSGALAIAAVVWGLGKLQQLASDAAETAATAGQAAVEANDRAHAADEEARAAHERIAEAVERAVSRIQAVQTGTAGEASAELAAELGQLKLAPAVSAD